MGSLHSVVASKRLSYREQRELESLPARIEALEAEQRLLTERIGGPEVYKEGSESINSALARAEELLREVSAAYARWHDLDERS